MPTSARRRQVQCKVFLCIEVKNTCGRMRASAPTTYYVQPEKLKFEGNDMEILEILKAWLMNFPGWGDVTLSIDTTDPNPGSCGLFPLGTEELSRREDVLGNLTLRLRQTYSLRRVAVRGEDAAAFMAELSRWICEQPAPQLGADTRIRGEKGRLSSVDHTDTATYEMKIIAEFEKEIPYGNNETR